MADPLLYNALDSYLYIDTQLAAALNNSTSAPEAFITPKAVTTLNGILGADIESLNVPSSIQGLAGPHVVK